MYVKNMQYTEDDFENIQANYISTVFKDMSINLEDIFKV